MNAKTVALIVVIILFVGCKKNSSNNTKNYQNNNHTEQASTNVFEKISSSESNINFSNNLKENIKTLENLFDFDYFYNGAGVGIEDINNDGLLDIFFCGNQVENKLYLNKGNLKFEDVTAQANINVGKFWANGVTFVDINNDGWKDIYVSQGGPFKRDQRKNLLFINQQNLTFKESAEEYGLADMGISTQSAFFDYDKDGDLDCIVMNENELYGYDPISFSKILANNPDLLYYNTSKLYRNDGNKFTDVTQSSGILNPVFGLGLCVSDINNDGWLDIYIASDYYIPDAMYINNKNGTFSNAIKDATNQISFYGMGVDIADVNNDALQDIFVLDMASTDHVRSKTLMASMSVDRFNFLVEKAKFQYQYMYNSLQLNLGNGKYHNIAQLSNTANTDWSWTVLIEDLNHDEKKDIYVTNGYRRYALDNDLRMKVNEAKKMYGNNIPLNVQEELYHQMPSEKLPNILYESKDSLIFNNEAISWGLADYSFSNGAAIGDLDNDGDLDLVVNNIDDNAFLYKNLSVEKKLGNYLRVKTIGNTSEPFAKVTITYANKKQFSETKRVRGYMSAVENVAHFGLGNYSKIDTITVEWPSGKLEQKTNVKANTELVFYEKDAIKKSIPKNNKSTIFKTASLKNYNIDFKHNENIYDDFEEEILLPYKQSTLGPHLSVADVNNDGLEDFYVGGAAGQAGTLYIQTNQNTFYKSSESVFEADRLHEDMESLFFDFDGDSDLDLMVISGGNEFKKGDDRYSDRLYINDGKGNFVKLSQNTLLNNKESGKTVISLDFDKDGDLDVIVGNRIIPKQYPKPANSFIYENNDKNLEDVTKEIAPEIENFGIINKLIKTDFNADGWDDFIVVGEWTHIGFFKNMKGTFKDVSREIGVDNEKGWWFTVKETDVNNDGLPDYIIGNVGLNIKFKASKDKPFKVYGNDFDDNGTFDIVLSKKYKDKYVPVRGRECSSQQMPFIIEKFPTYSEFANATLDEIYGDKLKNAISFDATEFRSMLLLNKGYGKFEKKLLPVAAQMFPVLDVVVKDVNNDSFDDLILIGNIYNTEVETPRLDMGTGLVLLSNKKDGYLPIPAHESGLYIPGNVKSLKSLKLSNKKLLLLAARNNEELYGVELNTKN